MNLDEGKLEFIGQWGQLGVNWGVSKTMAQMHALLLISCKPLCCDDIMKQLMISRGNVNMNIHSLMDWELVYKKRIPGERKDYFVAEKDIFNLLRSVVLMRKKKELDPMIKVLDQISCVEAQCAESKEFCRMVKDLSYFSKKADVALQRLVRLENNVLMNTFIKMLG